jgi:hypothetical protein
MAYMYLIRTQRKIILIFTVPFIPLKFPKLLLRVLTVIMPSTGLQAVNSSKGPSELTTNFWVLIEQTKL